MFELRRLTHGDRPVTGQENRKNVEDFFTRNLDPEAAATRSQEDNRPESVIVEVRGLVERRPVSSVLQSVGFRRNLERALRSSLGTVVSRQPGQQLTNRRNATTQPTTNAVSRTSTPEMAQAARPFENNHNRPLERSSAAPASSGGVSRETSPEQERTSFVQHLQNAIRMRRQNIEGEDNQIPTPPAPPLPPVMPQEYAQAWIQGHASVNNNQRSVYKFTYLLFN